MNIINKKFSIIIFILIVIISNLLHNKTKTEDILKREDMKIKIINFIHHITSNYLYFGSILFGYYKLHLTIIIFMIGLWYLTDDVCPVSTYINKKTNQKYKTRFKDLAYHIESYTKINLHYFLLIIIIFNIIMILKNN